VQKSIASYLFLGVATTSITTLALFSGTNSAQAATIAYADLASFQANTTGLTTIDFEGLAPAGGLAPYSAGSNISGVTFAASSLYVIDSAYDPILADWGSGAILFDNSGGTITATLPSGVTAVGSDIMSYFPYALPFTITLSTGETFSLNSLDYPNRQFVGFTSDTAIASISFHATTGSGYTELDNFRFGTVGAAATSVPEPFTIIGTLVGGTSALRMRKKLKSARK
jgi:hypothetical protein